MAKGNTISGQRRYARDAVKGKAWEIATSNRWLPLLRDMDNMSVEEACEDFVERAWDVATKEEATEVCGNMKGTLKSHISRKTKKAIAERRRRYRELRSAEDDALVDQLRAEYQQAKGEATRLARGDRMASWQRYVRKAADLCQSNRPRELWQWVQGFTGRGKNSGPQAVQPVIDPASKKLVTDPAAIAEVWGKHYEKLATDETGHSRDRQHWQQSDLPELSGLKKINRSIRISEVRKSLKSLVNGTAAGKDGIPPELLKAALAKSPEQKEGLGSTDAEGVEGEDGEEKEKPTELLHVLCGLCQKNSWREVCQSAGKVRRWSPSPKRVATPPCWTATEASL